MVISTPEWCPSDLWNLAIDAARWADELYVDGVTESEKMEVVEAIAAALLKVREHPHGPF